MNALGFLLIFLLTSILPTATLVLSKKEGEGKLMENNYMDPDYVPAYKKNSTDMSVGAWVGTLILTAIPIVGFICMIVWAVSSSTEKRSRKNWAIAQFILMLISIVITIILVAFYGRVLTDILSSL